jgi:hypothetical protein
VQAQPSVERTVSASDEQPASAGSGARNTYLLEVSTGSVRGGGTADNVKYFVIYYTTGSGSSAKTRSEVIFPGKDAMRKSMDAASDVANRDSRRQKVEQIFGYTTDPLRDRKGLGSIHTDQFLFTTPEPVTTIERIQIFGRLEETVDSAGNHKVAPSSWACQGMRISRVDTLYGLEMYGWYSDDGYIDYAGEVIADVVMASGGGIFHWDSSAGVFNIAGPGSSSGASAGKSSSTWYSRSFFSGSGAGACFAFRLDRRFRFRFRKDFPLRSFTGAGCGVCSELSSSAGSGCGRGSGSGCLFSRCVMAAAFGMTLMMAASRSASSSEAAWAPSAFLPIPGMSA